MVRGTYDDDEESKQAEEQYQRDLKAKFPRKDPLVEGGKRVLRKLEPVGRAVSGAVSLIKDTLSFTAGVGLLAYEALMAANSEDEIAECIESQV